MPVKSVEGDRAMVLACIGGDKAAWERLVHKYSALIEKAAANRLKKYGFSLQPHEISDIRQETLSYIWSGDKLGEIKNAENIAYWLAVVSGNRAMTYLRHKRSCEPQPVLRLPEESQDADIPEKLLAREPYDEEGAAAAMGRIRSAMGTLTAKERLVVKLNLLRGKRYVDISSMLGMPIGTVASHVKRAKKKMRRYLSAGP